MVLGGDHRFFFGAKVKTVKLIGGRRYLAVRSGLKDAIYGFRGKSCKLSYYVSQSNSRTYKTAPQKTIKSILNARTIDDLRASIYACPNHTDDGIHSDHGYLETCDNPLGPP